MGLQRSGTDRTAEVQPGGAPPKLKFKRDPEGKLTIDVPGEEPKTATEAAERPPQPDDPRSGQARNVPPLGGA